MVSLVIPVYNRKYFVEKMLYSVLEQTYTNWELILVDDGSTDGTYEMMHSFSQKDNRIRLYKRNRLPKGGQTCRNIGLEVARGEYIIFLDSDDLIKNTCVEYRVSFMNKHPLIDYAIFPAKSFVIEEEKDIKKTNDQYWGIYNNKYSDSFENLLRGDYLFFVASNIYKRDVLVKNHIRWDEKCLVFQDFYFNYCVMQCGLSYLFYTSEYDYFDYYYRIYHSENNVCKNTVATDKFYSTLKILQNILDGISYQENTIKYKRALNSFMLKYFRSVVRDNSVLANEYLSFIKNNTNYLFYLKLCIVCKMTIILNQKIVKYLCYILFPISLYGERVFYKSYRNFKYSRHGK